jgi:hypothetical protein
MRKREHWDDPIPGVYEYIPGRGWYLIATYKQPPERDLEPSTTTNMDDDNLIKMIPPTPVRYSKVLKRCFLSPDYELRKKHGDIPNERGKLVTAGFFQLDDGVAWVNCWDEEGEFIPGPYKLWCIDAATQQFRHMRRGDDPAYQRSAANSRAASRQNSFDRSADRRSQESRSTEFRSAPGSTRDAQSGPSTRANSIRGVDRSNPASRVPSQANSRRNSFSRDQRSPRSPRLRLDEAKAALSIVAQERAALERSRGVLVERESEQRRSVAAG